MSNVQLKHSDIAPLREKLKEEQNGICPICQRELVKPVLDHLHKKRLKGDGLVRGVICSQCNTFLAVQENRCRRHGISLEELPQVLVNISIYLLKPRLPFIHPTEAEKEPKLSKRLFVKLAKLHSEIFPNKKPLEYPKSEKMTKQLKELEVLLVIKEQNDKSSQQKDSI